MSLENNFKPKKVEGNQESPIVFGANSESKITIKLAPPEQQKKAQEEYARHQKKWELELKRIKEARIKRFGEYNPDKSIDRLKESFSNFLKNKDQQIQKVKNEINLQPKSQPESTKEYLRREQKEISRPIREEAIKKRNELLEKSELFSMSKEDFKTHFGSSEVLKQGNIGNCYAIAGLYALSRSPHFEVICRSSIECGMKHDDGEIWRWEVKIPLLSENAKTVSVFLSDIDILEKNKQFGEVYKPNGVIDTRETLNTIEDGPIGLKIIEAALRKNKNVSLLEAEGGSPSSYLLELCGDNFSRYEISGNYYKDDGKTFEYGKFNSLKKEKLDYVDHFLENFDPEIHIGTAYILTHKKRVDIILPSNIIDNHEELNNSPIKLIPTHAYAIKEVNSEKKIITLVNPHDTSKPINLTFDQFKSNFTNLDAVKIDNAKLLKNMKSLVKKAA